MLLALTTLRMQSHSLLVGCLYRFLEEWRMKNADINQRLLEVIEQIGSYSKQIRSAIEDGVVEPPAGRRINDELYLSISKLQEHAALVYKIFCISESNDARECAAPGVVASIASGCGETNIGAGVSTVRTAIARL